MLDKLDYRVLASGSSGNAVRIGQIMIDCGIPFSKMKDELFKCHTLLITHAHSDHVNAKTLTQIRQTFPRIHIYANYDVAQRFDLFNIIGSRAFKVKGAKIIPFELLHDVPCTGFVIQQDGLNIIYATDTAQIENPIDELEYDYIFLESNHDENKIDRLRHVYSRGNYDPIESKFRHLSTQKCKAFYYMYRRNNTSELIELHKSKRFY